ncbi:type VI secretion system lipoprotein TssJ [Mesorhizobium sp. BR1-1-16]|uniref:type VI secretion system lipoprotein TssJ n=1 Tax=Mesorhizobium sp. BR1-1-16 TaxID=2876653 RepID=UPI001CCA29B7|nr:type VI secretion system lipoprotein TssJ [Mesorhizobium sp. BR1-1-16]MBZ9936342.1 type VI secretion system lipoprotein TssJ [Mesorhizobium sp. BR1-1-16]
MIDRRGFIVSFGAAGFLAACQSGPPKPSAVTVNLAGQAGMNPGAGGDKPVTVLILRLRSTGKFNSADYFALAGDPGSALAGDLIGADQIAVGPGKTASKTITAEPEVTAIGFVALLKEPTGRNWRMTRPISPGSTVTVNVAVGAGGLSA